MKTLNIGIIILLSFFLILVGCAKKDSKSSDSDTSTTTTDTDTTTTSSYTRGNTPEKSSVDLPASLSGQDLVLVEVLIKKSVLYFIAC